MRVFSVSELWGPFPCEHPECTEDLAFDFLLTDEENASLPEEFGPAAVRFILKNKLGKVLCREHLKLELKWQKLKNETVHESHPCRRKDHPEYGEIVDQGEKLLPWLFRKLEADSERSFHLSTQMIDELTKGKIFIPREYRGVVAEIEKIYLVWGREHGYLSKQ